MTIEDQHAIALNTVFASIPTAAVACSGGVDSMTLAFLAHRSMGERVTIFHAQSAAVPPAATVRVREYAQREGWHLRIIDAGEFSDETYLANPANRCFFCKTNLYGALSSVAGGAQLFSGTNMDDLGDWRPGLKAAETYGVRHPFVEAELTKADVRALAAINGLSDIAELPSAPCLSSRVETGIRIDPVALRMIDRIETLVRDSLAPETVRCRVRAAGIVVELDSRSLARLADARREELVNDMRASTPLGSDTEVSFVAYTRGSAFLRASLNE